MKVFSSKRNRIPCLVGLQLVMTVQFLEIPTEMLLPTKFTWFCVRGLLWNWDDLTWNRFHQWIFLSKFYLIESGYLYFCLLQKVQERLRVAAHVSMERSLSLMSKHLWHIAVTEPTVYMSLVIYQYYFIAFHRIVQNKSVYSFFFSESHTEICFRKDIW